MTAVAASRPSRGMLESIGLKRETVTKILAALVIIVALIWTVWPIAYLFGNSFKTRIDMFSFDLIFFPEFARATTEHYEKAFLERDFLWYLRNSALVATATTTLSLIVGTLAAFALARFHYPGNLKFHLSFFILSVRMMPPIVAILPLFVFFTWMGLHNTKTGLIISYTGFNLPFVVWMMKSYFQEIPHELDESAMVDGDTRMGAFWRVILPAARPGLAATAIFCLILSWNEFLFALILTETKKIQTLPIGIVSGIQRHLVEWGEMSATGFVSLVPVIIFAFIVQRHLVRGLTFGAVRP